jgi:hypothetical protein
MVRSYMATVQSGAVTVRDVELPDGTEVSVSIAKEPVFVLTEQDLADIRQAEAEYERGEFIPGAQVIRELEARALHRRLEREREATTRPRDRVVGPEPNGRVRAARRRRA